MNTNGGGTITEAVHPNKNYTIGDVLTLKWKLRNQTGAEVRCEQEIEVIGQAEECGENARVYTLTETGYEGTSDEDYCKTGSPSTQA